MVKVNDRVSIPDDELKFSFSRSGGPGGQNVNKVDTRVALRFDVIGSPSLSDGQKKRVLERLATRTSRIGVLRVVSKRHRAQAANRDAVVRRFAELLREALKEARPRKKTRIPRAVKERRKEEKRRRGRIKRERSKKHLRED